MAALRNGLLTGKSRFRDSRKKSDRQRLELDDPHPVDRLRSPPRSLTLAACGGTLWRTPPPLHAALVPCFYPRQRVRSGEDRARQQFGTLPEAQRAQRFSISSRCDTLPGWMPSTRTLCTRAFAPCTIQSQGPALCASKYPPPLVIPPGGRGGRHLGFRVQKGEV